MWFLPSSLALVTAAALPLLSHAAPTLPIPYDACAANTTQIDCSSPSIDYDAIIVGGGPSGLACLSGLARVRRRVLLVDSGHYRNAATRHLHDLIGNDGQTTAYYRYSARKKLGHYATVTMTNGTITNIQPQHNATYFTVTGTFPGQREITYTARKIVLATGLNDLIPSTPGLRENFGKGIFWCPWCDGHEHADQQLGILCPVTSAPSTVREVSTLNRDVIAFTNGTYANDTAVQATESSFAHWQKYMKLKKAPIDDRVLVSIDRLRNGSDPAADPSLPSYPEHDLFQLNFVTGPPVRREAIIINVPTEQASTLPADVGVAIVKDNIVANEAHGYLTSVSGVYAVGDAGSGPTNIPFSLYSGKRAAVFLHVQLAREETESLLKGEETNALTRRSLHQQARDLWDEVNGQPGDVLYAGEFDQWRI